MKQKITAFLAGLLLLFPIPVWADDRVPALENRQAELTVSFVYTQPDGDETGIQGVSFSVYKIASLSTKGGSVEWSTLAPYQSTAVYQDGREVTYDGIDTEQSMALAKADSIRKSDVYASAITDGQGRVSFAIPSSDFGMFLVVQDDKADGYSMSEPFLVCVPMAQGDQKVWNYEVTASPKKAVEKESTSSSNEPEVTPEAAQQTVQNAEKPVQTGVDTDLTRLVAVLLGSTGILIILLSEKIHEGKEEK